MTMKQNDNEIMTSPMSMKQNDNETKWQWNKMTMKQYNNEILTSPNDNETK